MMARARSRLKKAAFSDQRSAFSLVSPAPATRRPSPRPSGRMGDTFGGEALSRARASGREGARYSRLQAGP
jgi:hypothetical protein